MTLEFPFVSLLLFCPITDQVNDPDIQAGSNSVREKDEEQNQDGAINGKAVFLIFAQNIHQPGEEDGSADGTVEIPHSSQDYHHDDQNGEPEAKSFRTGGWLET